MVLTDGSQTVFPGPAAETTAAPNLLDVNYKHQPRSNEWETLRGERSSPPGDSDEYASVKTMI